MKYHSTKNTAEQHSARFALVHGLAADGGLFMPKEIPVLPDSLIEMFPSLSYPDIALAVLAPYFAGEITRNELKTLVDSAFSFPVPLKKLDERTAVLELFHGPTCAFKDFGARFLARMLGHWSESDGRDVTVLVATSGDTGSAVAQGFAGVPGTRVVVLYPSGKVSRVQEQQMTTLGGNITALEIRGTFDDCQRLVKQAFVDPELTTALHLTSANSINIGRLFPQVVYYFWAVAQFTRQFPGLPIAPAIVVPSGNFGNVTAAVIARRMGLPFGPLLAAVNRNDTVPAYFRNSVYEPKPSVQTLSNAMDVGDPSNIARLWRLCGENAAELKHEFDCFSCSDEETLRTMSEVYRAFGEVLDPHTAVGYWALAERRRAEPELPGILIGTADPAKFSETVIRATGAVPSLPPQLADCLERTKRSIPLSNRYREFADYLLSLDSAA